MNMNQDFVDWLRQEIDQAGEDLSQLTDPQEIKLNGFMYVQQAEILQKVLHKYLEITTIAAISDFWDANPELLKTKPGVAGDLENPAVGSEGA